MPSLLPLYRSLLVRAAFPWAAILWLTSHMNWWCEGSLDLVLELELLAAAVWMALVVRRDCARGFMEYLGALPLSRARALHSPFAAVAWTLGILALLVYAHESTGAAWLEARTLRALFGAPGPAFRYRAPSPWLNLWAFPLLAMWLVALASRRARRLRALSLAALVMGCVLGLRALLPPGWALVLPGVAALAIALWACGQLRAELAAGLRECAARVRTARGMLIHSQWRLVGRSFWLWTALTLVAGMLFHERQSGSMKMSVGVGDSPSALPVLGFLAAALGARLFTAEGAGPLGMYWRALPLAPAKLFAFKLGFGTAVLALAFAVQLCWEACGLAGVLQRLWIADALAEPIVAEQCAMSFLWCLAILVFTAYFALAFHRFVCSTQAGVAGWFLAVFAWQSPPLSAELGLPRELWFALAGVAALAAAWTLHGSRGVVAGSSMERLRRTPRAAERPLLLAAAVLLVALPLLELANLRAVWPFLGWHPALGVAVVWLLAASILLPWRRVRGALAPTPLWILLGAILVFFALPMLLGGLRFVRAWEIRVADPEVEILLEGDPVGRGEARGLRLGDRLGALMGFGSASGGSSRGVDHEPGRALTFGALAAALAENSGGSRMITGDLFLSDCFREGEDVAFRRDGVQGTARQLNAQVEVRPFYVHIALEFEVDFPAVDQ